jgi:hypothetical protein
MCLSEKELINHVLYFKPPFSCKNNLFSTLAMVFFSNKTLYNSYTRNGTNSTSANGVGTKEFHSAPAEINPILTLSCLRFQAERDIPQRRCVAPQSRPSNRRWADRSASSGLKRRDRIIRYQSAILHSPLAPTDRSARLPCLAYAARPQLPLAYVAGPQLPLAGAAAPTEAQPLLPLPSLSS